MPPQSPSSRMIDLAIASGPKSLLKERGFRKSGRSFGRASGDVIHVVQFQSSKWNTADAASFTVNLIVTSPEFHKIYFPTPCPKNPANAVPIVSERLGCLVAGRDLWWDLTPGGSPDPTGAEIARFLDEHGLPFLDQFGSHAAILERLDGGLHLPDSMEDSGLVHAIIAWCAGDRDAAGARLDRLQEANADTGLGVWVKEVRRRMKRDAAR